MIGDRLELRGDLLDQQRLAHVFDARGAHQATGIVTDCGFFEPSRVTPG